MSANHLRHLFPFFSQSDVRYLDSAATSHKPNGVIKAVNDFTVSQNANVHRSSYPLAQAATGAFESARRQVQCFINASRCEEIIWTKGATEGINILAHSLAASYLQAGDEILLSCLEHHANIVPWQQAAMRTGAKIRVLPVDDQGVLQLDAALNMFNSKTALLAIGQVSNALGNINPLTPLIERARQHSALVLVDGAQAASHLRVDVQALDCDFYVFSGHKVYAPSGIGVLYGKYDLLAQLPPYQTGGEMVQRVSFEHSQFMPPPVKFEAGTPNVAGAIGLGCALDFVTQHIVDIQRQETALYHLLIEGLRSINGIKLWGEIDNSIALQSYTLTNQATQDVALMLAEQHIAMRAGHHCAMPLMQRLGIDGTLRASLACYNNSDDVQALVEALFIASKNLRQVAVNDTKLPVSNIADSVKRAKGWDEIYRQVMLAGKQLEILPLSQRTADTELFGCESQVWLRCEHWKNGLHIQAYSPSKMVRGLIAVIIEALAPLSLEQIEAFDLSNYLSELGLAKHLSVSRGNGLNAVIAHIKVFCASKQ